MRQLSTAEFSHLVVVASRAALAAAPDGRTEFGGGAAPGTASAAAAATSASMAEILAIRGSGKPTGAARPRRRSDQSLLLSLVVT
jgi:hypothetical protein